MYDAQMISDNDSIDFAFFDSEGDHIKLYEGGKQSSCSKIITQAVIESNNVDTKNIEHQIFKDNYKENIVIGEHHELMEKNQGVGPIQLYTRQIEEKIGKTNDFKLVNSVSDNTNKAAEVVEKALFNCLAYTNPVGQTKGIDETLFLEDKEYSSSSSSGSNSSTVTTITSDFTSISPLSFLSNSTISSLFEDSSTSSPELKNNLRCDDNTCADDNEDNTNSRKELQENEENDNESCTSTNSKTSNECENAETNNNTISYVSQHGSENQEKLNTYETDEDTENIIDENSLDEDDIKKSEDDMYSETWESGSENGEVPYTNNEHDLSFRNSDQKNDSDIGSWELESEIQNVSLEESLVNSSNFSRTSSGKILAYKKQGKSKRKKGLNLTFSREELIKIERDNLILLKKIMSQSKPRTVSINQTFSNKKTSTAINRAKHQKQIEQDNYILYSKINAMNRSKRVF